MYYVSPRLASCPIANATCVSLFYMNGVTIVFVGLAFGFIMWKTRHYKWWIMLGCVFRLIGYAMMFRIRTETNPPYAELYLAQVVQGLGDGLVQTGGFVATTVNVPHSEVAQMTALTVLVGILGQSVGTAIAGAIYTGTFREELWKQLGDSATYELVDSVFNSITADIPAWGTADRHAINKAVREEEWRRHLVVGPKWRDVLIIPRPVQPRHLVLFRGRHGYYRARVLPRLFSPEPKAHVRLYPLLSQDGRNLFADRIYPGTAKILSSSMAFSGKMCLKSKRERGRRNVKSNWRRTDQPSILAD